MVFNSLTFIAFFVVVVLLHYAPFGSWRLKKIQLLIFSFSFYAAWNPPFILLLWMSTLVDFEIARCMRSSTTPGRRRWWLFISLAVNLGVLGYFKYGEFLLENWIALMNSVGIAWHAPKWKVVLPVGISFYTFQTLSYTLDVYSRRLEPIGSRLDFALFVAFFPHLVAGPIMRPEGLVPQFARRPPARPGAKAWGLCLMVLGMFEKVVIADGALAPAADRVFGTGGPIMWTDAWCGTLAFSGQIFCDFAGYSTIAIGAALVLGFSLQDNFRNPYAAIGFSDFWRRWHVSLSSWLRDYLYIPLGGSRTSERRTRANVMITMLLGGLWHGASWKFVLWGGLHGTYLTIERLLRAKIGPRRTFERSGVRLLLALLTYLLVTLTWVFFRAADLQSALGMVASMLSFGSGQAVLPYRDYVLVGLPIGSMLLIQAYMRERRLEDVVARAPAWLTGFGVAAMALLTIITQGSNDAFIYFQF